MKVLATLTDVFLDAFQITRPPPAKRRQAEYILGGLVLCTLVLVLALIAGMLLWAFRS